MSTIPKKFSPFLTVFAHVLFFAVYGCGQDLSVKIKIPAPQQSSSVKIEINFPKDENRKNLSFPQTYADAERLAARIRNLKIVNDKNQEISFINLSEGEIRTAAHFSSVAYDLNLSVPEKAPTAAHVSWLAETHGLLMLNDLLPFNLPETGSAEISFETPRNWKISASENQVGDQVFRLGDIQNAVFLIGAGWKKSSFSAGASTVNISTVGDWNFTADEAGKISGEILSEYEKIFGEIPEKQINIYLLPFPRQMDFERWRAETRGANVVILSSPTAFAKLQTQRLHEQLRHELFHLWIPNNLYLTGDYSWFYEGVAQYAALKTGVKLNRITFSDFLNTLGQAVNQNRNQPISLLESSKARWRRANSGVYSDGMLVAFLIDAALLRESRGKVDVREIIRRIYQKHRLAENQTDGNRAVLEILQSYKHLAPVIEKYIKGTGSINFANDLAGTGIEIISSGNERKLQIKTKTTGGEKDLLNKLGYNNWRKILRNPK